MAFQVIRHDYDGSCGYEDIEFICVTNTYDEAMLVVEEEFNSTWFEDFGEDGHGWDPYDSGTYKYFFTLEDAIASRIFYCESGLADAIAIDRNTYETVWYVLDLDEPNVRISF